MKILNWICINCKKEKYDNNTNKKVTIILKRSTALYLHSSLTSFSKK